MKNIYISEKVRLIARDPKKDAARMAIWQRDTEFARLQDSDPVRLWNVSQNTAWIEKQQKSDAFDGIEFTIYTLDKDKPIGFVGLDGISWHDRTSWVGIGIGERDYWGKGYGTDAMQILAHYAFEELGLYRLNLNVFSYNTRAIRSYEKVGYKVEGTVREALHRDGKRYDLIFMGLLREDFRHK
ncbi:MAG: GNAT family N-acetyltransferase [Chloroflexi bacterium]|nr:GNAT family N-acetyltransferase [Chloroflexota bacterium]